MSQTYPNTANTVTTPPTGGTVAAAPAYYGTTAPYAVLDGIQLNSLADDFYTIKVNGGQNGYTGSLPAALDARYRIKLSSSQNWYVSNTSGSDSTGNGSSGNPWQTIQHASNVLSNNYDFGGNVQIVNIAAGTYTAGLTVSEPYCNGYVEFVGQGAGPTVISVVNGNCFAVSNGAFVVIAGMTVRCTGNGTVVGIAPIGWALVAQSGGRIQVSVDPTYGGVDFDVCQEGHMYVNGRPSNIGGASGAGGNYSIIASAWCSYTYTPTHLMVMGQTDANFIGNTVTFGVGTTHSFTNGFVNVGACLASLFSQTTFVTTGVTFSGTSLRYVLGVGSQIACGGSATYFPGNTAGTTPTNALYF